MVRMLVILLLTTNISFAQKTDSVKNNTAKTDSSKKILIDSSRIAGLGKRLIKADSAGRARFISRIFKADSAKKANPARKALIRSLILPGWGQATNKEYWVMPIVYGAAAGGIFSFYVNNHRYHYYKGKLTELVVGGATEVMLNNYVGIGIKQSDKQIGPFTKAQVEPVVNTYRRYRDLTVIVFAVGWALQAVQANVSAHLKNFDMSDDISIKFEPSVQPTFMGSAVGASLVFKFK
ncbi:DUF5683 domain-containing protein [Emticicia sp. 21SJ11W-3]|uniref:DUF5683 domain-containing protein n=1 Tax=Emticicia sp. 21SJ11W-3 TaxID=2916755 RepID=UPI0020A166B2|nr:DUF5683 domain-containing protein [Emticicia sp. 21SJ11W-3]UTA69974.1 DUF5683 domain-containing protein [Emticicia sp. 21SJ11W-3]